MATLFAHWPMGAADEYPYFVNDVVGSYGLTVTPNAQGFPRQVLFPNLAASNAREWSRAFEGASNTTDHYAIADVDPTIYATLAEGAWSCAFWFRRRPADSGETNTGGVVVTLQGADESVAGSMNGLGVRFRNLTQGGVYQLYWGNYSGSVTLSTATFTGHNPRVGGWEHVVVTRVLQGGAWTGHLYVDGAPRLAAAASPNANTNVTANLPSAARISVGAEYRWAAATGTVAFGPLNGVLYDLRLYSGGLTPAEVATLFREATTPWAYRQNVPHGP